METGLLIAFIGLTVGGLAAILGIWMERDEARPPKWAVGLTVLILLTTLVSLYQSWEDSAEAAKMEEDMARMLLMLDQLAQDAGGGGEGLQKFLAAEMEAQSRANPDIVDRMADRVTAAGGDPNAVLGKHLSAAQLKGVKTASKGGPNPAVVAKLKAKIGVLEKQLKSTKNFADSSEAMVTAEKAEAKKAKDALEKKQERIEELKEEIKALKKKTKRGGGVNYQKG